MQWKVQLFSLSIHRSVGHNLWIWFQWFGGVHSVVLYIAGWQCRRRPLWGFTHTDQCSASRVAQWFNLPYCVRGGRIQACIGIASPGRSLLNRISASSLLRMDACKQWLLLTHTHRTFLPIRFRAVKARERQLETHTPRDKCAQCAFCSSLSGHAFVELPGWLLLSLCMCSALVWRPILPSAVISCWRCLSVPVPVCVDGARLWDSSQWLAHCWAGSYHALHTWDTCTNQPENDEQQQYTPVLECTCVQDATAPPKGLIRSFLVFSLHWQKQTDRQTDFQDA